MPRARYREEFWSDVAEVDIFDRFCYAGRKGFALGAHYVPIVGLRGAEVPRAVPRLAATYAASWKPGAVCEKGGRCEPSGVACRLLRRRERLSQGRSGRVPRDRSVRGPYDRFARSVRAAAYALRAPRLRAPRLRATV